MTAHATQEFYGATTIGEKGQVVIPAEARTSLKLGKGEKLLVFSLGNGMLVLSKLENLAKFERHLAGNLAALRKAVKAAG